MPKRCQVWGLLSMCAHHPRQIVGRDLLKRSSIVHIKIHKYDQSKPASFWSPLLARQTSFFQALQKILYSTYLNFAAKNCWKRHLNREKDYCHSSSKWNSWVAARSGGPFQTWLTDYWFLINSTKILSSSSRVLNSELLNSWKPTTLRQKAEFIGLRKNNKDPTMFNFQA